MEPRTQEKVSSLAERPIAWVNGRRIHEPWPSLRALFLMTPLAIAVIVLIHFEWHSGRSITFGLLQTLNLFILAEFVLIVYSVGSLLRWAFTRWRTSTHRASESGRESPDQSTQSVLRRNGGIARHPPWRRFNGRDAACIENRLAQAGLPRNLTVVDLKYANEVRMIPLIDDLLEMESMKSQRASVSWMRRIGQLLLLAFLLYGTFVYFMAGIYLWVVTAIGFCWVGFIALGNTGAYAPSMSVAGGPGFVTDKRGRMWTIDNSAAYIKRDRFINENLAVEIIGPDGRLLLRFDNPKNLGFIAFWQRWRHPHPRLELATEQGCEIPLT